MNQRLRFPGFELDATQLQLRRADGTVLDLPRRQLLALQMLAERSGELVDKETLINALWPGLVVEENNLSQLVASLRRQLGDFARESRYIQTVPRRGFRFVAPVERMLSAGPAGAGPARVAVLPFKPLLAEQRDALLEFGMADSLIARLSLLPWLAVLSIGTVRRYAGADQDPLSAAAELGVRWVVDGTLQSVGDELSLRARLLDATDGTSVWSASFHARLAGIFEVQDRIGEQLALALAPALRDHAHGKPGAGTQGGTHSLEAYRLYLQGMRSMNLQRADELRESMVLLRRSLDVDPDHARAWVGLADANRRAAFIGEKPPLQTAPEVETAVRRALALAPHLGEAHATLGYHLLAFEYDWPAAERAFRRSIELNPSLPIGHFALGQLLLILEADEQGFAHLRRAVELDPMQPLYAALEASFLRVAGRLDEAQVRLRRVLQTAPGMPLANLVLAQSLLEEGDEAAGIAALRRAAELSGGSSLFDGLLGHHLARLGHRAEARQILERLQARACSTYVAATTMAAVHAGLGDRAQALDALDRAVDERDLRIGFVKDAPYWACLRAEPRFADLLRRIRLDGRGRGIWNP